MARPMMYLALTYDHRMIDGREVCWSVQRISIFSCLNLEDRESGRARGSFFRTTSKRRGANTHTRRGCGTISREYWRCLLPGGHLPQVRRAEDRRPAPTPPRPVNSKTKGEAPAYTARHTLAEPKTERPRDTEEEEAPAPFDVCTHAGGGTGLSFLRRTRRHEVLGVLAATRASRRLTPIQREERRLSRGFHSHFLVSPLLVLRDPEGYIR